MARAMAPQSLSPASWVEQVIDSSQKVISEDIKEFGFLLILSSKNNVYLFVMGDIGISLYRVVLRKKPS